MDKNIGQLCSVYTLDGIKNQDEIDYYESVENNSDIRDDYEEVYEREDIKDE